MCWYQVKYVRDPFIHYYYFLPKHKRKWTQSLKKVVTPHIVGKSHPVHIKSTFGKNHGIKKIKGLLFTQT